MAKRSLFCLPFPGHGVSRRAGPRRRGRAGGWRGPLLERDDWEAAAAKFAAADGDSLNPAAAAGGLNV